MDLLLSTSNIKPDDFFSEWQLEHAGLIVCHLSWLLTCITLWEPESSSSLITPYWLNYHLKYNFSDSMITDWVTTLVHCVPHNVLPQYLSSLLILTWEAKRSGLLVNMYKYMNNYSSVSNNQSQLTGTVHKWIDIKERKKKIRTETIFEDLTWGHVNNGLSCGSEQLNSPRPLSIWHRQMPIANRKWRTAK